ncbi:MAG: single-stranded-DNA-specific exonuclease RecJ [Clostridia bacterium]|nr:single-stranded-DNA-specific exonuclease RecJ [Clostridia bacterium]
MGKINAPGSRRDWIIKRSGFTEERSAAESFSKKIGRTDVFSQILMNRGIDTPESAADFIEKRTETLCDPLDLNDMDKAVKRTVSAIKNGEKIAVYGDYDVDGITSVALLTIFLRSKSADTVYYIPSRFSDGYGMSSDAVKKLCSDGCTLIITVDTGVTAFEETVLAGKLGCDVIITDHHECMDVLPDVCAVINPKRADCSCRFRDLAGVGVAFKFACAVECALNPFDSSMNCIRKVCYEYADLVALGTIADVMPLTGENRLLTSLGINLMNRRTRVGITALAEASGIGAGGTKNRKITSGNVSFMLSPRLNAAGRLGDATLSLKLLLESDPVKAYELADQLCEVNQKRQNEENRIMESALNKMTSCAEMSDNRVIVLWDDEWHQGIIGIVASRLSEKFRKPVILITFDGDDSNTGKGSGRSAGELNLVKALEYAKDHLIKYGGHSQAAGLTINREDLEAFSSSMNEYAAGLKDRLHSHPEVADVELLASDLTVELGEELYLLEPFGNGNPVPLFVFRDAEVTDIIPLSSGKHTKLLIEKGSRMYTALCFGSTQHETDLRKGDHIDILFSADINEFRNEKSVQIIVRELQFSAEEMNEFENYRQRVSDILNGTESAGTDLPGREDFATLYTLLRTDNTSEQYCSGIRTLARRCSQSIVKTRIVLEVLNELGLIEYGISDDETVRYKVKDQSEKKDLNSSSILKLLKGKSISNGK